jgi:lambda family phage portal protein
MSLPALVAADGVTPLASAETGAGRDFPLSRPFRAASTQSQEMAQWRPAYASADSAIFPARDLSLARARDVVRDDPHARAGLDRRVDLLIGAGVRLVAQFDAESLGLDRKTDKNTIRDLRRAIEREWRLFALDPLRFCDATRQMSLNGRLRQLARTWAVAGETTSVLRWRRSGGGRYRTCVQTVDPDRLCNPNGEADSLRLRGGIEFDEFGVAIAYHIRNAHLADWYAGAESSVWERVPRETRWGRPVFVHGFEPEREGQTRSITPFHAIVQRLKMIGQHGDLELANATANALVIATMESNSPVGEATARMNIVDAGYADQRTAHYEKHRPAFNGVRIPVLPVGDTLKFNASPRQTTAFPAFQTAFLRSIASALGISYEQLSMDWSQTNYSSARAALNEVWRGVRRDFAAFVEQVVMPIYLAFLEEAFDRAYIVAPAGVPKFWDMPAAWAASRWIGSPRGYVDPVKEAQGAGIRLDNLTSTLEIEAAEQGLDFEDLLDQREYEDAELKARGLERVCPTGSPPANAKDEDANSKDTDEPDA